MCCLRRRLTLHPPSPTPTLHHPSAQVLLKERSIKEVESTHLCTQVFVVISGQPRSVQVDISGNSYLVSPGDHFFVPEDCEYRLANHSEDTPAEIAFVVIKPRQASGGAAAGAGASSPGRK